MEETLIIDPPPDFSIVGTAWDVGWAVVYLASDEAKWVTGVVLPVDAGVQAASPLSMLGDIIGSEEPKSNLY